MFGALFLLSAFVPPHSLEDFGPPQAATPEVKPDWYLLWIYGFLKIVPADVSFRFLGATIGPEFIGRLLFPALVFGVLRLAPWMDRTNRHIVRRYEYLDPLRQGPIRTASGVAMLTFLGTLFVAAYYDQIGLSLREIWAIVIAIPIGTGILTALVLHIPNDQPRFDPRESLESAQAEPVEQPQPAMATPTSESASITVPEATSLPDVPEGAENLEGISGPSKAPGQPERLATLAARGDRARDQMVSALHQMGEMATLVRQIDNDEELLEVLGSIESLRALMADSSDTLQSVVRAHREDDETWGTGAT